MGQMNELNDNRSFIVGEGMFLYSKRSTCNDVMMTVIIYMENKVIGGHPHSGLHCHL